MKTGTHVNCNHNESLQTSRDKLYFVEEEVVAVHRGRYNNNKVYYRLSHDVITWDVDRDVSTAYC